MTIEKYTKDYKSLAKNFTCGNLIIDNFLHSDDALDTNQGITYILLSDDRNFIIGYYNIEVGRIDQLEIVGNEKYYRPMGGAVNINYLAIHSRFQGFKIAEVDRKRIYLGDYLLRDCEKRISKLRKEVGISFITLYSTEEGYHLYHERNSYEDFEEDMNTFVHETDTSCHKLYKWIDDIIEDTKNKLQNPKT
jgi:hypothetical protein